MRKALPAALIALALPVLLTPWAPARAQVVPVRIVEWVEDAPVNDDSKIALGYPVPVPVETPLPFAGFRSYAGLHLRHQDLAVTTPWVHPATIGVTQQGRNIWLYRLGDADSETAYGLPEQAMLTNGGIHAREWQSPEVATGIIELLALGADDDPLIHYLRDNANVLVIPVLNVDGFLQTQRFPRTNWLGTDPDDPASSPRDGRMRRKNMRGADEALQTQADHLLGIDLNRNNPPYWATNLNRSSFDPNSLVHHGASPQSEAEIQALDAAAQLGPAARLSMYTDLHSFSRVHFWVRNSNDRLANLTEDLLRTFSEFHRRFPAGKVYGFTTAANTPRNQGIGATDEYFTHTYQVPAWTLEIEPLNGGTEYGGFGRNVHDGFILPDAEVERVRTELAQTFAIAYYRQAGPPSITALHLTDTATGAVVFAAEWDSVNGVQRQLHTFQAQPLQIGRDYRAWIAWDKPMRWRTGGQVTVLPGQPALTLNVARAVTVGDAPLDAVVGPPRWLDQPGASPGGYRRYRDDAVDFDLTILDSTTNQALVQGAVSATLHADAYDMSGNRGDADPATVARWASGAWAGYEDSDGNAQNDQGGSDATLSFTLSADALGDPFVVEAGTSAAWFDTERDGEGFVLEILAGGRAVMYWFTYDGAGRQDWYVAEGEIRGNRILFPGLLRVAGGEFGPGFDPDRVTRTAIGSASFIWSSCDSGAMSWVIDRDGGNRRQGRMNLTRLSRLMGLDCGMQMGAPEVPAGRFSGSWYDPAHSGEGYVLEVLADMRALVYWFSFDAQGARRWFFGTGLIDGDRLVFDELHTTAGGVFGPDFDPAAVTLAPWGSLELDLTCAAGTARFTPTEAGFPAGTLDLVRLTQPGGRDCVD
ncbi:MAG: hypothetical protein EHM68_05585 [Lysobacterales bacterium]|nr:MAG: hypothetical protein EHM68_05585 [Xanthomonadales bacterium]